MSEQICGACRRPKANIQCELCEDWNCKSCAQTLAGDAFSFRTKRAPELSHTRYCQHCWQQQVEPALAEYEQKMAEAREVYIFFTTQKRPLPILSKEKEQIRVLECDDRDETISHGGVVRWRFTLAQRVVAGGEIVTHFAEARGVNGEGGHESE